jgi:hypothetical protein
MISENGGHVYKKETGTPALPDPDGITVGIVIR